MVEVINKDGREDGHDGVEERLLQMGFNAP